MVLVGYNCHIVAAVDSFHHPDYNLLLDYYPLLSCSLLLTSVADGLSCPDYSFHPYLLLLVCLLLLLLLHNLLRCHLGGD